MSKSTEIRQQTWTAPLAANATRVLNAHAADGSTQTPAAQPDVARTLQYVSSGTDTTHSVTTNGTDIQGNAISETVTLNGTTVVHGTVAFATVTNIVLPTVAANNISVGIDTPLGLDCYADENSFKGISGVSSFAHNATVISSNYVTLSASLDGSTDQAIPYIPSEFPEYGRAWG